MTNIQQYRRDVQQMFVAMLGYFDGVSQCISKLYSQHIIIL